MNYLTRQLLNQKEIAVLIKNLEKESDYWEDGKKTAGSHASKVKNNLQFKRDSETSKKLSLSITTKIITNPLVKAFAY